MAVQINTVRTIFGSDVWIRIHVNHLYITAFSWIMSYNDKYLQWR